LAIADFIETKLGLKELVMKSEKVNTCKMRSVPEDEIEKIEGGVIGWLVGFILIKIIFTPTMLN
jgi:hypothetical protein